MRIKKDLIPENGNLRVPLQMQYIPQQTLE